MCTQEKPHCKLGAHHPPKKLGVVLGAWNLSAVRAADWRISVRVWLQERMQRVLEQDTSSLGKSTGAPTHWGTGAALKLTSKHREQWTVSQKVAANEDFLGVSPSEREKGDF